jgi:hypothetical protein
MNAISHPKTGFPDILHADGPAPDLADKLGLYGRFVGSWEMEVVRYQPDGKTLKGNGAIHFGWVLSGRAIQDVWIAPRRDSGFPPQMFGTTLRIYDPGIDAWHIIWSDPAKQYYSRQTGRADRDDIVQIGTDARGENVRWRFTEITPDSFHWIGERSTDGQTWQTEVEFFARRVS